MTKHYAFGDYQYQYLFVEVSNVQKMFESRESTHVFFSEKLFLEKGQEDDTCIEIFQIYTVRTSLEPSGCRRENSARISYQSMKIYFAKK